MLFAIRTSDSELGSFTAAAFAAAAAPDQLSQVATTG
jgi:hypothetical protein